MKVLIFDSSTIINFALNGMLDVFIKLRKKFNGKFIMTQSVKKEVIDTPMTIRKYELAAFQIKKLLEDNVFEDTLSIGIREQDLKIKKIEVLEKINHSFTARNNFMHIIDDGEASCIALSIMCKEKNIENAVIVDERTTRILGELPMNMKKIFERKLHTDVIFRNELKFMEGMMFLRSSELLYVAWKKGLIDMKDPKVLDALLYASKFKGCSVSNEEIEEIKKIG